MPRGPENTERIQAVAADYLADTARALEVPEAALPAQLGTVGLGALALRAARVMEETRRLAKVNAEAFNVLFGSFVPAVVAAQAAAHDIALTEGQFTPTDEPSLAQAGTGLHDIREYLAPFKLQEDAPLADKIPPISISTILRLKGMDEHGRERYLSESPSPLSVVEYGTEWPSYALSFRLPVLTDPRIYTIEEFAGMPAESADGYAGQVTETWRSIRESERDNPSFAGEPLVIRAVAVLPVPPAETSGENEFEVDFLPQIAKPRADIYAGVRRAYDVRMLVNGKGNTGANYIKYEFTGGGSQPIFANSGGKRAPLTVRKGKNIERQAPSAADRGLTPRSQGAVALYIAPHVVGGSRNTPRQSPGDSYVGDVIAGRRGLGSAQVSVGPASSWVSSDKATEGLFGHVVPDPGERPIIMSIQLFTFER